MTPIKDAPTASWMLKPRANVSAGMMMSPPPSPSSEPIRPATIENAMMRTAVRGSICSASKWSPARYNRFGPRTSAPDAPLMGFPEVLIFNEFRVKDSAYRCSCDLYIRCTHFQSHDLDQRSGPQACYRASRRHPTGRRSSSHGSVGRRLCGARSAPLRASAARRRPSAPSDRTGTCLGPR